jgi:hypothetical protein
MDIPQRRVGLAPPDAAYLNRLAIAGKATFYEFFDKRLLLRKSKSIILTIVIMRR